MRTLLLSLLCALAVLACGPDTATEPDSPGNETMRSELGGPADAGFARAEEVREFDFPADHGPHPAFRNEWWYLVGNLEDEQGRRHGFQVTFFRIGLAPGEETRASAWASNQMWMAHLALTDVEAETHYQSERFARDGDIGLAGAEADGRRIWLEDWALERTSEGDWHLTATTEDFALNLSFDPERVPMLHGEQGLSQKSAEPGNASYYYSKPRLATHGEIRISDDTRPVSGRSWLDREWSTSVLGDEQEGWDWFALQLDDGTDVMIYEMRRFDGERSPYAYAAVMPPDGEVRRLGPDEFEIDVLDHWTSPRGDTYPARWRLRIAGLDGPLEVVPVLADQEFTGTVRYWEGAADVLRDGASAGRGYVELAGYAGSGMPD